MTLQPLNYSLESDSAYEGGDQKLEELISKAGRERVFARANILGWKKEMPPKWVWRQICYDLLRIPPQEAKEA